MSAPIIIKEKAKTIRATFDMMANKFHGGVESGVLYGLSCRINGSSVIIPYTIKKSPTHGTTHI
jgi:hypothetical protein